MRVWLMLAWGVVSGCQFTAPEPAAQDGLGAEWQPPDTATRPPRLDGADAGYAELEGPEPSPSAADGSLPEADPSVGADPRPGDAANTQSDPQVSPDSTYGEPDMNADAAAVAIDAGSDAGTDPGTDPDVGQDAGPTLDAGDAGRSDGGGPVCAPGERYCDGLDYVLCTSAGLWERTTCAATAACHRATCSELNGCGEAKTDGGSCDDGSACTSNDTCSAGICAGTPVDCSASGDGVCRVGVCDLASGDCTSISAQNASCSPDTDPCSDESCPSTCGTQGVCSYTCEGAVCPLDCTDPSRCEAQCLGNASCDLACGVAASCSLNCRGTSDCDLDCERAGSCDALCRGRSTCEIRCDGRADCRSIECRNSACLLHCGTNRACGFAFCSTNVRDCGGGVLACNTACP